MEGDPDLRSLIASIQIPGRVETFPPFPRFSNVDADGNVIMLKTVSTDTAFAAVIQQFWIFTEDSINQLEPAKSVIFDFYFESFNHKVTWSESVNRRNDTNQYVVDTMILLSVFY